MKKRHRTMRKMSIFVTLDESETAAVQDFLSQSPRWNAERFVRTAIRNQLKVFELAGGLDFVDLNLQPYRPLMIQNGGTWPVDRKKSPARLLQLVPKTET